VRGTVAVERGPVVYCVESVDLPAGLDLERVAVVTGAPPVDAPATDESAPPAVNVPAIAAVPGDPPRWPYGPDRTSATPTAPEPLRLIPFFARANRGPAAMRVFLPEYREDD
jgi:DUF1680 family protein